MSCRDIPKPALSTMSIKAPCTKNPETLKAIERSWNPHNMRSKCTGNTSNSFVPVTRYLIPGQTLIAMIAKRSYTLKDTSSRTSKMHRYWRQDIQGLNGTTWKDFEDFLLKRLRPAAMRNVNVKKCYLKARQTFSQTVSSFTAYLN